MTRIGAGTFPDNGDKIRVWMDAYRVDLNEAQKKWT